MFGGCNKDEKSDTGDFGPCILILCISLGESWIKEFPDLINLDILDDDEEYIVIKELIYSTKQLSPFAEI